ncbi:MAG: rRNA synthase [Verrucomicrobiota bacterium]|jgi:23S rRNA pseudouridine1911/1915/1917 synthase
MATTRDFTISPVDARRRIDVFLAAHLPEFSRVRIQKLIREGFVTLNGNAARPAEPVRAGDRIRLIEPPIQSLDLQPEEIALSVLFEDSDLVVLNKPAGISVHPGAGQHTGTLVNALLAHCKNLSGIGGKQRPGIVHRLDKGTSGCLVVAKNDAAHLALSKQFAARTVEKTYLALVSGRLRRNAGTIEAPIARHRVHRKKMTVADKEGREARTDFRVVRSSAAASLLECRLHSGRTHQIRVHLQHLGHPILGDKVYGNKGAGKFLRPMLHAWKLAFDHPRTKARMHFEAGMPVDFEAAIREILA